jgi:hypothetical protein
MDLSFLPVTKHALEEYFTTLFDADVNIVQVRELKDETDERIKEVGYGIPLLIEFSHDGTLEQIVLHTMVADGFGHERASDRARNLLLDHTTFGKLPRHVRSLDVGAFTRQGRLVSLGEAEEFFLITRYAPGRPYAEDLERIATSGELSAQDNRRADALADYLVSIHAEKNPNPILYRRRVRDLVGHGEGIMGIVDGYPADFQTASPMRLEEIERHCVTWRWRIKAWSHRLSQVHGDFHPWNVLLQENAEFVLLDRSRGEWGEPADDLAAMTINYILFSLRRYGELRGPFQQLFESFWDRYMTGARDEQVLEVIQPFYAWRALVLANPVWYPSLLRVTRESLFRFIENVLDIDRFDPGQINGYLT